MPHTPATADFISAIQCALDDASYVKLSIKTPRGAEPDLKSVDMARVIIKRAEKLSITYHYKTKDIVKNFSPAEALAMMTSLIESDGATGTLFTMGQDIAFPSLKKSKPRFTQAPSLSHDRTKHRHVDPQRPYLQALKITDASGQIFKNAQDKFKQIDKYIETLSALIKTLPDDRTLKIVDMGSGKGYLTFALYDYMHSVLNRPATVIGVEYRQDMVNLCNKIAKDNAFDGLHFVQGTIEDYDASGTDILIALHACDTATDDAIHKGIDAGAAVIVVAPCCHKQIRRAMEQGKSPNDLGFILKYGTYVERQAEMITDGLRALILEYYGYSTKLFEFISDAHTPKNVMITAIKDPRKNTNDPDILAEIKNTKNYFGIDQHYLEKLRDL